MLRTTPNRILLAMMFAVATLLTQATPAFAINSVTITERVGQTLSGYPVTFGRGFKSGEIAQYPQALLGGTAVLTQADVKNRWPDGTVKYAVISFLIPQLGPNQSVTVTFQNAATGNNTGFLTATEMLATPYAFDATMQIAQGSVSRTASARQMLTEGRFEYWLKGPIVTSIVLADHSAARSYDMGFDVHRPLRPIFHAAFYPANTKVRVRFIGEAANTAAAEDILYDLTLRLTTANQQVYSKAAVAHHAFARWTKQYWIGGAPSDVDIDHNTAYLIEGKFLENYDLTLHIPETVIASSYGSWASSAHDLFDNSVMQKHMPSSGGRTDIGPHPAWVTQYLYTWDHRSRDVVFNLADLAAAWPKHFREAVGGKPFNREGTIDALGKPISIVARPSLLIFDENGYMNASFTAAADRISLVGPVTNNGWHVDNAHQPEVNYVPYLVSGDYFYLEQLTFWVAHNAFSANPVYGRNNGTYGGIQDQNRAQAWHFRTRALAAFITPDAFAESAYFNRLMIDAIAMWEGWHDIQGSALQSTAEWQWAHGYLGAHGVSALHFWNEGNEVREAAYTTINPAATLMAIAPWEISMLTFSMGRARELGFPTDRLISFLAGFYVGQMTDPNFSPYYIGAYQIPTVSQATTQYFPTWSAVRTGFQPTFDAQGGFLGGMGDVGHGYPHIARAGISMITQEPGAAPVWSFMQPVTAVPQLNNDPKWAINPRAGGSTASLFLASIQPNPIDRTIPNVVHLYGQNIASGFLGLDIDGVFTARASLDLTFINSGEIQWSVAANSLAASTLHIAIVNPNNERSNALNLVVTQPGSGGGGNPGTLILRLTAGPGSGSSGSSAAINGSEIRFTTTNEGTPTLTPTTNYSVLCSATPGSTPITIGTQNITLPFGWDELTGFMAGNLLPLSNGTSSLRLPADTQPLQATCLAAGIEANNHVTLSNVINLTISNLDEPSPPPISEPPFSGGQGFGGYPIVDTSERSAVGCSAAASGSESVDLAILVLVTVGVYRASVRRGARVESSSSKS